MEAVKLKFSFKGMLSEVFTSGVPKKRNNVVVQKVNCCYEF